MMQWWVIVNMLIYFWL